MTRPEIADEDRADLVAELGDCFVEASGNMVLRLMRHGLRPRPNRSAEAYGGLLSDPPNRADLEMHLTTLAGAIEETDGATASEAVYKLSCLFRQEVRQNVRQKVHERSGDSAPSFAPRGTHSGVRS
jgi:hypothetical protein